MPKSRKRSAAKAKAVSRQRPGTREGRSPWMTVPRTTYGQVRPAPPPGRQWPTFNESPWLTWAAFSALRKATPEERAELGMPPAGVTPEGLTPDMQLALVEIAPWRIAPGWADAPLSDRRAEWTSLAAEATLSGNIVADLVEHLADLEERGLIKWDQEPQTALLAANLDEALKHPGRGGTETPVERDSPVRRILPPSRDAKGHPSPSWLLVQAAQLAIETSSVLHVINGTGMNLAEERRAQSEAAALLENAARAAVIMESGMPLAAAWSEGPPRARAIFARAREAGSDVASVMPDFALPPTPPVPPEIRSELEQASWKDPDPLPQCAGVTKLGNLCGRKVFKGIGSAHCHDHFTDAEQRRHDLLEAARARVWDAEEQVVLDQRRLQAEWWLTATGGCRPDWRCRRRPR